MHLPCSGSGFFVFFGIWMLALTASEAQGQQKNPYHLPLTTSKRAYYAQVDSNPNLEMIDLEKLIPGLKTDIRYATENNFTHKILYAKAGLFLRKAAAVKLQAVQDSLSAMGLCLVVFDGYRPYSTTLAMWEVVPDDRYAANPANGSGHNRGIAVDVTLANISTGQQLPMPTDFDDFTDTAHHDFMNLDSIVLANRATLKNVMVHFGFRPLATEWWHFSLPEPQQYPLMNMSFRKLKRWIKQTR